MLVRDDLNSGTECTLSKLASDPKLGVAVDSPENGEALQRGLDRLGSWATTEHMKFKKSKCQILPLGWDNPGYTYKLGAERLEGSSRKRDPGAWVDGKLNRSLQCPLTVRRANRVPSSAASLAW